MDIKQLQYFLALSKQEHMTITAEFLGISQPALSKSIRSLEKELGAELFDRHENRIRLNRNGQEFAEYAQRMIDDLNRGKRALQLTRYDFRGTIRITCHAFADCISDCVTEYMRLNPQIRFGLFQSETGDVNISDRIDFLLDGSGSRSLNREWISTPLFQEEAYLLISPRYRQYPPEIKSISPYELKEDTFISDYLPTGIIDHPDLVQRMCQSAGFQPKVVFSTDDFITKIHMVDEGLGITVLPRSCLRIAKDLSPDLQIFSIEDFPTLRTVSLLRRKDSQLSEAAMDFWEFAQDYYRE